MKNQPKSNLRKEYEARMGVVAGDFKLYNEAGMGVYYEDSDGWWIKHEYNEAGEEVYHETSDGLWVKQEYNEAGAEVYYEDSDGFWEATEYNEAGVQAYYGSSKGTVRGNRPPKLKTFTDEYGNSYELVRIQK